MDKFLKGLGAAMLGIFLIALGAFFVGLLVMWVWNWLMPMLFDLPTVTYIEGWGIAFLSGLLFKGTTTVNTKE